MGQEIPVDVFDPQAWQVLQAEIQAIGERGVPHETALPAGISDYVLYRDNGGVLAVVEAKCTSVDPRAAQAQTEFYDSEIAKRQSFQPFAFMTNGHKIHCLDKGHANKRRVSGFFRETDLLGMLHTQQHGEPVDELSPFFAVNGLFSLFIPLIAVSLGIIAGRNLSRWCSSLITYLLISMLLIAGIYARDTLGNLQILKFLSATWPR